MEANVFQLFLIILYGFFINFEKNSTMFGTYQPVTAGFITGLILGDVTTGLFIGGTLQLLSLGISNFGGASIPDYQTASIVATFITITTGQEASVGISIGIPVALLMVQLDVVRNTIGIWMVHQAEAGVKKGNYGAVTKMQMFGVFLTAATTGIPVALAVIFGPSLINTVLAHTPEWLTNGLTVAGGLLPAVGIGLLLRYLPAKEYFSYLVIGFVLSVYLNVPLLGVALIGGAIALIIFKKNSKESTIVTQNVGGMNEDE
ncbi:PTS mannose/fructose/sorbose/N-acetylgalactosamine transporter subunit IIC [Enterococcus diestrammenae]|uniref:PTS mannose/fructose/sorbose/N-acetylgalactosamine transporter subunit IIC n=1 Tax=Enterococcus diestrammenae TaxID=1155073 RepID=UPI0022E2E643|nr:PTS sugar transporter subunit IIC [Enterococcus diestrammenae]